MTAPAVDHLRGETTSLGVVSIQWLGGAHFAVTADEDVVRVDPWIRDNPGCPISFGDVLDTTAVLVTHGHPGHFGRGDAVTVAAGAQAPLVGPAALVAHLVRDGLLPSTLTKSLDAGSEVTLGSAIVSAFGAPHPPVRNEFTLEDVPTEPNHGYIIRLKGRTVVHVGDTCPDEVYHQIADAMPVDVALLPLWAAEMVWDEQQALRAFIEVVAMLHPKIVVPHARFRPDVNTPDMAKEAAREIGLETAILPLRPGDRLVLVS